MNRKLFLYSILLISGLLCACSHKAEKQDTASKRLALTDSLRQVISMDTVRNSVINDELLLNGKVGFDQEQVARVYPIFGGNITNVSAEIGDYVKKGQTLAVICSGEVADYEKQQRDAVQQTMTAKRSFNATNDMYQSGMASQKDLMLAKQEMNNALSEQRRMKEIYRIYHVSRGASYAVKSPVSGFIVEKNVNRGMQIRSDQTEQMFTITGLNNIWVMADIYESDISKVKQGASVRITTLAYPNMEFTGKVNKIYNMLDSQSKTLSARIKLKNTHYLLKPGMFTSVYVQCKVSDKTLPCIDAHALIFEDSKNYVVVIKPDKTLEVREVHVFKQTDKYCYIDSGVGEGEVIVNKNALLVYNALIAD
jgi:cobalt-zinc-cadmium efflux system membrane fusion protein